MESVSPFLISLFEQAVKSAQPRYCLPGHLPPPAKGRNVVLGAGKASAEMAKVLEDHWQGPLEGLVVTRYGHRVTCETIEILEAVSVLPRNDCQSVFSDLHPLPRRASGDMGHHK